MLLRSNGRVRFVRLSPRLQVAIAVLVGLTVSWGVGGTLVSMYEHRMIAERDGRLVDAQTAYDDLLEEIAIYQQKVADVTGKLRQNQADLAQQLALADALQAQEQSETRLMQVKPGRMAAISEARIAMRQHLEQLNTDVRAMTDLDTVLKTSLQSIRSDLVTAVAERKKGYRARAILLGQVKRLKDELRDTRETSAGLLAETRVLGNALAESQLDINEAEVVRAALESRIASLENTVTAQGRNKSTLLTEMSDLRQALSISRDDYKRVSSVRAQLDVRLAALEGALRAEEDRANGLEADMENAVSRLARETGMEDGFNRAKETLGERADVLLSRLTLLHEARAQAIENLNARTAGSIDEAERILGMTGLNVDKVLARVEEVDNLGKGGPFVAVLPEGIAVDGFAEKVVGLDSQLLRLTTLQSALAAIPLVAPVDAFRIASGFGKRKDPISKKWAVHSGLDLSAPTNTAVYTSAPGTVVFANWKGRYGRMIEIDHGYGIKSRYGHLRKILVKKGQRVSHRDKIALIGSSGRSTGPHLHYEILYGTIAMDPMRFIKAGKYVFKEQERNVQ